MIHCVTLKISQHQLNHRQFCDSKFFPKNSHCESVFLPLSRIQNEYTKYKKKKDITEICNKLFDPVCMYTADGGYQTKEYW